MDLRIEALAAHPQLIPTVAGWIYQQWWTQVPAASPATVSALLRENLAGPAPPLTLVACDDARPLGTVSVLAHDVGTQRWAALSPWLAALYVVPGARRRGIGGALIDVALTRAAAFAARVYLLTTDQEAFYACHGWQLVDSFEGATVMARTITPGLITS